MIKIRKLLILLTTLAVASTLMVGCASNPQSEIESESPPIVENLEERVLGRWDALINKDFTLAYESFSPAYRKLFPLQHYLSKTGSSVSWKSVRIEDYQITDNRAEVKLSLDYTLDLPMGAGEGFGQISKTLDEIWLWKNGEWWYVILDDGALF